MILYVNGDSHTAAAEAVNPHCFAEDDGERASGKTSLLSICRLEAGRDVGRRACAEDATLPSRSWRV